MIHRIGRTAAVLAALLVGSSQVARADGFTSWTVCGGNTFNTCAAVQLSVVGTHVTMRAWNLSGMNGTYGATVFTGIGLYNVPSTVNLATNPHFLMSGPVRPGDTPGQWQLQQDKQIGGGIKLDLVPHTTNGVHDGIANGCANNALLPGGTVELWENPCGGDMSNLANWVTFTFDVSSSWDPSAGTYLLVKGQNGPNGWSTECYTGTKGDKTLNCMPTTSVPEPVTMALLGTGLAGLGGFRALRRRREGVSLTDG